MILRAVLALAAAAAILTPAAASAETYCFGFRTDTAESTMSLDIPLTDGPVAGTVAGSVQDPEQGYYTSWRSTVTGERIGDTLDVTVETAIEDDVQVERQTWILEGDDVVTERNRFQPVPCEADGSGFDQVPSHASEDITTGHCTEGEDVVLTCETAPGEVLSVCLALDRSALAYRFGPVVQPELEFPDRPEGSLRRFRIHSLGYSGGYDTRLGFDIGDYTFAVYERMISRGPDDPTKDMSGGVLVYENGFEAGDYVCDRLGEAGIGLGQLYGLVPEEPFFDEEGLLR